MNVLRTTRLPDCFVAFKSEDGPGIRRPFVGPAEPRDVAAFVQLKCVVLAASGGWSRVDEHVTSASADPAVRDVLHDARTGGTTDALLSNSGGPPAPGRATST